MSDNGLTATYSPDDNKLRLYADARLGEDLYKRVHAAGFRWAPRQELFVAPAWSPAREDLLLELCGEIGDEDTSLVDRAEERAERFEGYQESRAKDAESAHAAVSAIADGIPMGQPILVGRHSEKRARKDAERIEQGMRRALRMWDTSKYWEQRAAGALHHAKHKELPAVRCRRIKKLEAERRKLVAAYTPHEPRREIMQRGLRSPACAICGRDRYGYGEPRECAGHEFQWPEEPAPSLHVWAGSKGSGTWVEVSELPAIERRNARWIAHIDKRLLYERAMLAAGGDKEPERPKRPKLPPILNYRAKSIEVRQRWSREPMRYTQKEMTRAEYQKPYHERRWVVTSADGSHRIRFLSGGVAGNTPDCVVFLTDSKVHPRPETGPVAVVSEEIADAFGVRGLPNAAARPAPERTKFDDLRDTLREGVKAVSAPSLFETPPEVIVRIMDAAEIAGGHSVLEPSAGAGRLARAAFERSGAAVVCVEVNADLCQALESAGWIYSQCDFMEYEAPYAFDRVVMNPPFERGQDAAHVRHAFGMLKPGGRLVAVMSPGPFFRKARADREFRAWLEKVGGEVEDLPAGSFKESGTGASSRLVTIEKGGAS